MIFLLAGILYDSAKVVLFLQKSHGTKYYRLKVILAFVTFARCIDSGGEANQKVGSASSTIFETCIVETQFPLWTPTETPLALRAPNNKKMETKVHVCIAADEKGNALVVFLPSSKRGRANHSSRWAAVEESALIRIKYIILPILFNESSDSGEF